MPKINSDNVWFQIPEVWLESLHSYPCIGHSPMLSTYYVPGIVLGTGDIE